MNKCTITPTILAFSILLTKSNFAAPILTTENNVPLTGFNNIYSPTTNIDEVPISDTNDPVVSSPKDKTKNKHSLYDFNFYSTDPLVYNNYEIFYEDSQTTKMIDYDEIRNEIILDLFEDKSILDDYDFSYYQESLKELVDGKHIIPMQLIALKSNIDSLVYENGVPTSENYYISDFDSNKKTNKKKSKKDTNTLSDWELFYNSKYYTWIRNIFIISVLIIIFKDIFPLKKTNNRTISKTTRTSRFKRR